MKRINTLGKISFGLLVVFSLFSCNKNKEEIPVECNSINKIGTESGSFDYSDYAPFGSKVMKVYYYVPASSNDSTPILFVFHGVDRNAKDYRDAMISKAQFHKFIVIAPEFSDANFPTGDKYNLGNVFVDGDNPSSGTLNVESTWTFSVIEPLFDFVKEDLGNTSANYHIFGHSAGGQFAHRFIMFKPNARYDKVVASASGWYTVTDVTTNFPYGFKESPLVNSNFLNLFSKKLIIQVGSLDNDPNASGLRRNTQSDVQGTNRFDRANYFYNAGNQLATNTNIPFNWSLYINLGKDHNYVQASLSAADLIFN